jgi:CHAD domain-containing protein
MMNTDKLQKLVQLCCDVMNAADELDIDIGHEMDAVLKKIQSVSDVTTADDLHLLRVSLRPLSKSIQ